jgi:hypothetical protein
MMVIIVDKAPITRGLLMVLREDFVPPLTIAKAAWSTLVRLGPMVHVLGSPVVMFVLWDMHVRRGCLLQRHVETESIA